MKRIALALGLLAAACVAPIEGETDSSEDAVTSAPSHVLALGDSITFAWDPNIERDPSRVDPKNYRGYAEMIGERIGAATDNAACPGETSSHFVHADGEDNGCAQNRAAYGTHVPWGTSPAQLDFVRAYLARTKPSLVTMSIGGNDLLRIVENCKVPVVGGPCMLLRLPFYEHAFRENLATILRTVHGAGYRGKMAILTTYGPDYSDVFATFGLRRFNDALRETVADLRDDLPGLDVRVADGFAAFEAEAKKHDGKTCATGLVITNADGTCDLHPSEHGHEVLAGVILAAIR